MGRFFASGREKLLAGGFFLSKFRFVVHLTPERANVLLIVVSAINYQGRI